MTYKTPEAVIEEAAKAADIPDDRVLAAAPVIARAALVEARARLGMIHMGYFPDGHPVMGDAIGMRELDALIGDDDA